jgi:prepilin-type N-terminal cleavage/methylation domain-containing protein
MKLISPANKLPAVCGRRAFTLIEMLVVIAIIGVLAAMIIPLAGLASNRRIIGRTRIEIDNLALAIDTYKLKKGSYPPDNPTAPAGAFTNQLFYELWGMILQNPNSPPNNPNPFFTNTFNAREIIDAQTLTAFFGNPSTKVGIVNASPDTNEVINFIPRLNAAEIQNINVGGAYPVWVFAAAATGPALAWLPKPPQAGYPPVNVIRYVSSNPTNNQSTYDLWVDVLIGGKTNRISNWIKDPEIVGY